MRAMKFDRAAHAGQVRKYTGEAYHTHLAEVAALSAAFGLGEHGQCIAWLHDTLEDTSVSKEVLEDHFGAMIRRDVVLLTDQETGNRAERKYAQRMRLAFAGYTVQTVKCADIVSNAYSIIRHDPKFAKVYVEECHLLLDSMKEITHEVSKFVREVLNEQRVA